MKKNNFYNVEEVNNLMSEESIKFLNDAKENGFTTFSNIIPTNENEFEFYHGLFINSIKFAFNDANEIAKCLNVEPVKLQTEGHTFAELYNEAKKSQYVNAYLHGLVINLEHTYYCNKYYSKFN